MLYQSIYVENEEELSNIFQDEIGVGHNKEDT